MTASTLLHRLILSIELDTVQTGTGKVDPARKFKCTKAARAATTEVNSSFPSLGKEMVYMSYSRL